MSTPPLAPELRAELTCTAQFRQICEQLQALDPDALDRLIAKLEHSQAHQFPDNACLRDRITKLQILRQLRNQLIERAEPHSDVAKGAGEIFGSWLKAALKKGVPDAS